MSTFKVYTRLGITSYSTSGKGQFKLLVPEDNEIPSIRIFANSDIDHSLEKISRQYLGYSFDWLTLVLLSVNKTEEELYINYCCMVPPESTIKKGRWENYVTIYQNNEGKYQGYEEILANISKVI